MRIHLPSKGRGRGSREVCWTRRPMRTNLPIRSQGDASILKYYESHKRRLRTKPAIRNQGDASRPESCKPHKRCPLRIHRPFKGQGRGSRKAFWTRRPSRTSLATRSQGDASRPEYCKLLRTRHKRLLLSQFGGVCGSHRGDASSACSSANTEASAEANRGDASSACTEADTNHTQNRQSLIYRLHREVRTAARLVLLQQSQKSKPRAKSNKEKPEATIKHTIEYIIKASNLPPGEQALLPKQAPEH